MEILQLIRKLIGNAVNPIVDVNLQGDVYAVRQADGEMKLVDVRPMRHRPWRRAGHAVLQGVDSFLAYVEDHKSDEMIASRTVMFIDPIVSMSAGHITVGTAVLDYHESLNSPARCENTAALLLQFHPMFRLAQSLMSMHTQESFGTNLRKCGQVFVKPSAADMLTLAQTLRVHASSNYHSVIDPGTGSINFLYQKENRGTAGGYGEHSVTVPDTVRLCVPMFVGMPPIEFECRFEFRAPKAPGEQVEMRLAYDAEFIDMHDAVEGVIARLESTGLQCLRGAYSNIAVK